MITASSEHRRLDAALRDFAVFRRKFRTQALRRMAQAHKRQIKERLRTKKSGPSGESWGPWLPSTGASRQRRGNTGQGLLVDDKKLVNSFRAVYTASKGQLGSSLPYAAALQFGVPSRNLVARPYAGVGTTDKSELQRTLDAWARANNPFR